MPNNVIIERDMSHLKRYKNASREQERDLEIKGEIGRIEEVVRPLHIPSHQYTMHSSHLVSGSIV